MQLSLWGHFLPYSESELRPVLNPMQVLEHGFGWGLGWLRPSSQGQAPYLTYLAFSVLVTCCEETLVKAVVPLETCL